MDADRLMSAMQERPFSWEVSPEPIEAASRLGYLPSEGVPPIEEQEQIAQRMAQEAEQALGSAGAEPSGCDLRAREGKNFITPIRDQGACGSCVTFGSCAAVEGTFRLERDEPELEVDLSEAFLFYCVAAAQGRRCSGKKGGWYPKEALKTIEEQGVPDEACFPYTAGDQPCTTCENWESKVTKIERWAPLNDPGEMKEWICGSGPVVASMQVYEDFQHYAGGVYRYVEGEALGGHCICIVGYDDRSRCWIAKNSWGTGWGERGFFRIGFGQCGIDSGMLGVSGVR